MEHVTDVPRIIAHRGTSPGAGETRMTSDNQ